MRFLKKTPMQEAEALERAADMAREENDPTHEKALRQAALFRRRLARERAAGFDGYPICTENLVPYVGQP